MTVRFSLDLRLGGEIPEILAQTAQDESIGAQRRLIERWVADGIMGQLDQMNQAFVSVRCVRGPEEDLFPAREVGLAADSGS